MTHPRHRRVFDFALTADEMRSIATLDTGTSSVFDHRDPAMVKLAQRSETSDVKPPDFRMIV